MALLRNMRWGATGTSSTYRIHSQVAVCRVSREVFAALGEDTLGDRGGVLEAYDLGRLLLRFGQVPPAGSHVTCSATEIETDQQRKSEKDEKRCSSHYWVWLSPSSWEPRHLASNRNRSTAEKWKRREEMFLTLMKIVWRETEPRKLGALLHISSIRYQDS